KRARREPGGGGRAARPRSRGGAAAPAAARRPLPGCRAEAGGREARQRLPRPQATGDGVSTATGTHEAVRATTGPRAAAGADGASPRSVNFRREREQTWRELEALVAR